MPQRTPSGSTIGPAQPSMWSFFRAFLRDRKTIGAVAPTSPGVGRNMARLAGVAQAKRVVEFGPGTGPITREVLAALPEDGRLWAYEIYEPFLEPLREMFPDERLTLLNESAENVRGLRDAEAPEGFDAIVCSIPFSLLPPVATHGIIRTAAQSLRPGGTFVALQYHPTYLQPIIRQHFEEVRREIYPWNIPPAMLLIGRRPRSVS